ncbi:uncharacterized protein LOC106642410 [Copidosoma floridanum]|uniref:uncharacterized protein LOC106642410 n=1 Tax=Copidosoma floridanum TaxID=29053 RepID=UPI0006C9D8F0|nr:uncharacterized protein LOC106642410 [Copidosoma floridanum]
MVKKVENSEICSKGFHGFVSLSNTNQFVDLARVMPQVFQLMLKILSPTTLDYSPNRQITIENRLLLFLVKMKSGMTFSAIGVLFNMHRTTASKIFYCTLEHLIAKCQHFIFWPSRETVQATMPTSFKQEYKNCRIIIDCTEFEVEQPVSIKQRVQFYSHYKKGYRVKVLVGCTPSGFISLLSKCHGGRASDSQITISSGILDLLEPGDLVLADKGFPQIKTLLDDSGRDVLVVMPPFLENKHFTAEEVDKTRAKPIKWQK